MKQELFNTSIWWTKSRSAYFIGTHLKLSFIYYSQPLIKSWIYKSLYEQWRRKADGNITSAISTSHHYTVTQLRRSATNTSSWPQTQEWQHVINSKHSSSILLLNSKWFVWLCVYYIYKLKFRQEHLLHLFPYPFLDHIFQYHKILLAYSGWVNEIKIGNETFPSPI